MSGHSKWATIKHKKGALDAKRGKIFTRLIKEITMAAKAGGGDPEGNPRLRGAVAAAKAENMPADNIKRAIQRGTGELPGATYEEFQLEGYGPGGVAILLDINTDNRNRTVSEIRHAFGKNGGNMAAAGAVAYLFHKKGDIVIAKTAAKEDDLMSIVLEAGADDLRDDGDNWEVLTETSAYEAVLEAVKKAGIEPVSASVTMIPQNYIKLEGSQAATMIRLIEAFEEHDDVQNVHANFDIDQKLLEEVAAS
jgi:YebC/PmpR family DNA-binding regulatory protein